MMFYQRFIAVGLLLIGWSMLAPAVAAAPTLSVVSPTNATIVQGTSVKVEFNTSDIQITKSQIAIADYGKRPDLNKSGQGHLHLSLDLWPMVVWDQSQAYTFINVPPGEHTLKVELVNNDHSSLSPPIVQEIRFQSATQQGPPMKMPNTSTGDSIVLWPFVLLALALVANGLSLRRRSM